ncbi:MAG: metal-dependent transcriptional regulator [Candidatus Zixiibacteriota bacterium]
MAISRHLSASLEDYLETILLLSPENDGARVKDISASLKVNYSSVTGALQSLAARKLVNYSPYTRVTLTKSGAKIARDVLSRHVSLKEFFIKVLSIDEQNADEAACRMEHCISQEVLDRFVQFAEYIERCPKGIADWDEKKGFSCRHKKDTLVCSKCRLE